MFAKCIGDIEDTDKLVIPLLLELTCADCVGTVRTQDGASLEL